MYTTAAKFHIQWSLIYDFNTVSCDSNICLTVTQKSCYYLNFNLILLRIPSKNIFTSITPVTNFVFRTIRPLCRKFIKTAVLNWSSEKYLESSLFSYIVTDYVTQLETKYAYRCFHRRRTYL